MAAGPTVRKIRKNYQNRIRLVIKNYPYQYRDYARMAAEASLDARDQGKYWEMHDILIARSPKLDRDSLISYARELKLDVGAFTEALDKRRHDREIDRDIALAKSLDLYNTPTFFINGRKVVGERSFDYFKPIIDEALNRSVRN